MADGKMGWNWAEVCKFAEVYTSYLKAIKNNKLEYQINTITSWYYYILMIQKSNPNKLNRRRTETEKKWVNENGNKMVQNRCVAKTFEHRTWKHVK